MMFTSYLTLFALTSLSGAQSIVERTDGLTDCLKSRLSHQGSVILPNQPIFANDTGRYSELYAPTFRVISKVANENDVRVSIQCAQKANTTFFITGNRHGFYEGLAKVQGGLEILTEAFNDVSLDANANVMTVGGATDFQKVIDVAYAAKKDIPTGSGLCVGIVGAGLGAGIGRLEGLYGLIIDSLVSVRIMLPNTTVIEASTTKNPELFWGIRGAGWNFGFVMNATFRVYDQVPKGLHLNADILFPGNKSAAVFQKIKDNAPHMPAALAIATGLSLTPTYNDTTLLINAVYAGPEVEGRKAIQFLLDAAPILEKNISVVPWNNLIQTTFFGNGGGGCDRGDLRRSVAGIAFDTIDPSAHTKLNGLLKEMIAAHPSTSTSTIAMYFPATQAARAIADNATAYAWRQVLGHMAFEITYADNNSTDANTGNYYAKFRDTIKATGGTGGLQAYVGFSHGDEPLEAIFAKDKLPRLAALKKKYDPSGLFNAYHPLPTQYP